MGILDRMATLIKSNLNAAIDSMSDPGREIDQLLLDMKEHLRQARAEVQSTLAAEKRERQQVEVLARSRDEWQARAERAVAAGDEGLAKEALARRLDVEAELAKAQTALDEQAAYVTNLTHALRELEARYQQASSRKETLKAQARSRKQAASGGDDAVARYEKLVTGVDVAEAEVALDEELAAARHEDAKSREVERKLADLEKDHTIEDRLAALKEKLKK